MASVADSERPRKREPQKFQKPRRAKGEGSIHPIKDQAGKTIGYRGQINVVDRQGKRRWRG